MYYKLGQATVTNWASFVLLQIRAKVVTNWGSFIITNWGSYYKLEQRLLQNRAVITNWGNMYYKLGQVLQIRAIIARWGITHVMKSISTEMHWLNTHECALKFSTYICNRNRAIRFPFEDINCYEKKFEKAKT